MTSSPNPTWYDVLGVDRTASPDEIKAAWRASTDKFEPGSGSGQFRMFNDAADVLLDPTRRREYDAELAGPTAPVTAPPTSAVDAPAEEASPAAVSTGPSSAERRRERKLARATKAAEQKKSRPERRPASRGAKIIAVVLAVLTVAAIATATWFGVQMRTDNAVADARDEAPAAAEQAAKALFSYDYRTLPTDRARASHYVTDKLGKQYLKVFDALAKQKDGTPGTAVQTKTTVKATVAGSGVVDAEDGVARVLVYVNQVSSRPGAQPQIFQNRVTMTMEKDGNRWLVDEVKSY